MSNEIKITSDNIEINGRKILKEKSADEIFEELGYKKITDKCCIEEYVKEFDLKPNRHIIFSIDKEVCVCEENKKGLAVNADYFSIQELQAINKKVKELGYIEC